MAEIDEIRIIKWYEHRSLVGVKEALDKALPGLDFDGPYCPGKKGHWTFRTVLDGQVRWVHVNEMNLEVIVENSAGGT